MLDQRITCCVGIQITSRFDSVFKCPKTNIAQFRLLFYSIDGKPHQSFEPAQKQLGIKTVSNNISRNLLAVGGYDHSVTIINSLTLNSVIHALHPAIIRDDSVIVFSEVNNQGIWSCTLENQPF